MSAPKHTPGPWSLQPMGGQAVSPRDGFFVSWSDSLGVRTDVAHVRPCPTHGMGEVKANAQLIAAAPDMKEELRRTQALLILLADAINGTPAMRLAEPVTNRFNAIAAVLAKAEGRP